MKLDKSSSVPTKESVKLDDDSKKIIEAKHHDPFSVLGRHPFDSKIKVKLYLPYAETVRFTDTGIEIPRIQGTDFFEYTAQPNELPAHYRLSWIEKDGGERTQYDPYDFGTILPEFDRHLFGEGRHWHIYQKLGAHLHSVDGIAGVYFAVWAPNAGRVSVVGDFNRWDGRCNPMRCLSSSGIWELFVPGLNAGCLYKFE
ncbi:MAG: GlgB N-terminal domain-containing protein, partial [Gammaproteobacteria bacterium]